MRILFFLGLMVLFCAPAQAQQLPGNTNSEQPLEITADGSLEWKRVENLFIARDNAKAEQGPSSVAASVLTAKYREGNSSSMEIHSIEAEENVVLRSQDSAAYGDHATYNLDDGLAVMTGQNLRMISPDQTITARDKFEYWVSEGRVVATGNALVERPKPEGGSDKLRADKITATLKDNAQGKRSVDTVEATGNVVITTPGEVVTGNYGIYRAATNKAEITGGVTITRGQNVLEGERAVVDMTTNTSQLFGSAGDGRVRGVFYPGSKDKESGN